MHACMYTVAYFIRHSMVRVYGNTLTCLLYSVECLTFVLEMLGKLNLSCLV